MDAGGCDTLLSWLIGMFVFDILEIPNWCIHIHSGGIAVNDTPLFMCMVLVHIELFYGDSIFGLGS